MKLYCRCSALPLPYVVFRSTRKYLRHRLPMTRAPHALGHNLQLVMEALRHYIPRIKSISEKPSFEIDVVLELIAWNNKRWRSSWGGEGGSYSIDQATGALQASRTQPFRSYTPGVRVRVYNYAWCAMTAARSWIRTLMHRLLLLSPVLSVC